jgi:HD-GYP domain-containing protein (c-di-GMP phosphodiesterase class II)
LTNREPHRHGNAAGPSSNTPNAGPNIGTAASETVKNGAGKDPLEAIYALNIGDFIAENFISDELLTRISHRLADDPQKLKAQLEELIHIYSIDKTLGVLGLDAQCGFLVYDSIAASLAGLFEADACHLFQASTQETGEQTLDLTGTSVPLEAGGRWEIGLSTKADDFLCEAYRAESAQTYPDVAARADWHPLERLRQSQTRSLIAAPLREGGRNLGVLLLERAEPGEFSPELVRLADSTARVLVTSMRLQQLVAEARQKIGESRTEPSALQGLRARITESIADLGTHQQAFAEDLSAAVDARHHFTRGHSKRVGTLARLIAEQLRLNEKTVDLTYMAGLLGSIGKISIPRQIIGKKEALSPEEWECLREHPNVGVSLLVKINFLSEAAPYVHSQNERWDGSGSPEGLKGRSVPLGARILAVANAYQAMTQTRPYRGEPLTHTQALLALREEAGSKWDPLVVDALARIAPELLR